MATTAVWLTMIDYAHPHTRQPHVTHGHIGTRAEWFKQQREKKEEENRRE